jgi:hypothetical protein
LDKKDIFTISFTFIGLIISITALYLTQFRRAKITASLGPSIHIYYYPPDRCGIYLPAVFHNRSPIKAIVYQAFLEIEDTRGNNFALKWLTSNDIDKEINYSERGPAAPFKIDGYEAISNALQFLWINGSQLHRLEFLEGSYRIRLHIWTTNRLRPDVSVEERFDVDEELASVMDAKRKTGGNTTRYLPLAGKGMISFTTGQEPIDFANLPQP